MTLPAAVALLQLADAKSLLAVTHAAVALPRLVVAKSLLAILADATADAAKVDAGF
ncbi:MAG: hypothetical protein AB8B50_11795 [Pirellulaceae bacterium]